MKTIGYARTSTTEQDAGFDAQRRELEKAGCDKIYAEQVSSVADRPQLERALDYLRDGDGDVFVVTKLDRFARSLDDAIRLEKRIASKGAFLRVLAMNIDTATPTGRLMFNVLASVAQFEREIMLERQREGIAAARAAGRYKGRIPTVRNQAAEILRLHAENLSNAEIARRLGVHRANVGRVLKAATPPVSAAASPAPAATGKRRRPALDAKTIAAIRVSLAAGASIREAAAKHGAAISAVRRLSPSVDRMPHLLYTPPRQ